MGQARSLSLGHAFQRFEGQPLRVDELRHEWIDGRVHEIGNKFFVPEDQEDSEHGEQPVSLTRVFHVEVRFTPPPQLADEFVPGTKGYVQLP